MSHANELRKLALGASLASQPEKAAAARAGADALDAVERVRHALSVIARKKADTEYARGHDDDAEWYVATADALEYAIHLLTEALEGSRE